MKNYTAPEMEITKFEATDIITASGALQSRDVKPFTIDGASEIEYASYSDIQ